MLVKGKKKLLTTSIKLSTFSTQKSRPMGEVRKNWPLKNFFGRVLTQFDCGKVFLLLIFPGIA